MKSNRRETIKMSREVCVLEVEWEGMLGSTEAGINYMNNKLVSPNFLDNKVYKI